MHRRMLEKGKPGYFKKGTLFKRGTIIDLCIRSVKSFLPSTCIYHPDSGFWFNNLEQRSWNKDLVEIWEQRARTRQKTKQKPGQHPSAGKRHICKAVGAGWRTLGAKLLPLALGSPRIALLAWIGKGEGKRSTPIKEVGKKGKESEIKLQISNGDENEIHSWADFKWGHYVLPS